MLPGGDRLVPGRGGMGAERAGAGEVRDPAGRVDHRELAVLRMRLLRDHLPDRLLGGRPGLEQVEQPRPERRVGDVLRGRRAHAGAQVQAARGHGRARRAQHHAERAGGRVARGQRERHEAPLITAVASISTSHSGRASASTTSPVETG